jgi:LacI family transcriptional regulator, gluconate utilization system Gnt-I transcriptional repressor
MARKTQKRHVRMEDVARQARVSAITVSRALSSPHLVSDMTRERIARAVAKLRYVPNRVAGSLASNRSNVIGAIIPNIRYSALEGMVQGLSDAARERAVHLILITSGDSLAGEEDAIEAVLAQRPDGICLHNTVHTPRAKALIAKAGIPVVETGDLLTAPLDATVSFSNFSAAKSMTLYLAARGYSNIAFGGRPVSSSQRARERLQGYQSALKQLGRKPDRSLILQIPGWMEGAAVALKELLTRRPEVDAVFFSSGNMAIGGLMECRRQDWAVPKRLAIAGFDDNELAAQVSPGLTTVRIPRYEIGRKAAQYLMDRARGLLAVDPRIDLGFEIVSRGTA